MERSVKKLLSSIIVMVFAGNIMMMIPTGLVRRMYEVLFKYGKWDPRHLQFIWNADRESVFWFFVFVLMAVLVVINLIRMISALISLVRGSGQAGRTAAGEKETEQVSRPYQTERRRAAMQKQQQRTGRRALRAVQAVAHAVFFYGGKLIHTLGISIGYVGFGVSSFAHVQAKIPFVVKGFAFHTQPGSGFFYRQQLYRCLLPFAHHG